MKKRFLSILLALCMLLTMLPVSAGAVEALPAGTAPDTADQADTSAYTVGKDTNLLTLNTSQSMTWKPAQHTHDDSWTALDAQNIESGGTLGPGNFYLSEDMDVTKAINISGQVTLCLNGHKLNFIYDYLTYDENYPDRASIVVESGADLTICDCQITPIYGTIAHNAWTQTTESRDCDLTGGVITGSEMYALRIKEGGQLTLESGNVAGNLTGVVVDGKDSKFTMTGGTITGNNNQNGGIGCSVSVVNDGNFEMKDGVIAQNTSMQGGGVYLRDNGYFTMTGGTITDNTATATATNDSGGGGGGVYVGENSTFVMSGGSITDNTAANGNGGGVYLDDLGKVTLNDSSVITGNTAQYGGGVYAEDKKNSYQFTMTGDVVISNNKADVAGGGVYLNGDWSNKVQIDDGTITENQAIFGGGICVQHITNVNITGDIVVSNNTAQYGGGIYLYGGCWFVMSGGSITGNTAKVLDTSYGDDACGGGVCVQVYNSDNDPSFSMKGGSITGNQAATHGGGVYTRYVSSEGEDDDSECIVSGNVQITDNTLSDGSANNYWLSKPIIIDTDNGGLSQDARIGLSADMTSEEYKVIATQAIEYQQNFTSDDSTLSVVPEESWLNKPLLLMPPRPHSHEDVTYSPISSLGGSLATGNYYLEGDVTATDDIILNPGNNTATYYLCLNGNILDLNGHHIEVQSGKLVICDCQTGVTYGNMTDGLWQQSATSGNCNLTGGVITGGSGDQGGAILATGECRQLKLISGNIAGNTAGAGGGVYSDSGSGEIIMEGGSITGNRAQTQGGGIYTKNSFYMEGGSIDQNTAFSDGGGVYENIAYDGFYMEGGSITQNTAHSDGGGVYAEYAFVMTGGTISGNTAQNGGGVYGEKITSIEDSEITGNRAQIQGGGVYSAAAYGNFAVLNVVKITGNTLGNGAANNVYLAQGGLIVGELADGSEIGVTLETPGVFANFDGAQLQNYLFSDRDDCIIVLEGERLTLKEVERPAAPTPVVSPSDENITSSSITIPTEIGKEYAVVPSGTMPAVGAWKPGTGGNLTFDGLKPGTAYDILVRYPANSETPASNSAKTTVTTDSDETTAPVKPAPPTAVTKPSDENITSNSITIPTETGKEYAVVPSGTSESAVSWTAGTGKDMTFDGLEPGTEYDILVRIPADGNTPASDPAKITVTTDDAGTPEPVPSPADEDVTSSSITIQDSVKGQEYIVVSADTKEEDIDWDNAKDGTGGKLTFDELEPGEDYVIWTRVPGTDTTEPSDAVPSQPIYTRPAAPAQEQVPTPNSDDITDHSITIATDSDKEYAVVPKGEYPAKDAWKPGTGGELTFDNLKPGAEYDILVRYPAQGELPASDPAKTTVTMDKSKPTAPVPAAKPSENDITSSSIIIRDTVEGQEYIVLPADQQPKEDDWANAQDGGWKLTFDELEPGEDYAIWTRKPETDTTLTSDALSSETVYTRPAVPTQVPTPGSDDITTGSITIDTETGKEYAVVPKGEDPAKDVWITGNGDKLTFDGLEPDTKYDILVRVPADGNTPASDPAKTTVITDGVGIPGPVQIPSRDDITAGSITIPTDSNKEYAVVSPGATPDEDAWIVGTGGELTFGGLESETEYDIVVRYPAKGDEPASEPAATTVTTDGAVITITWSGLEQVYGDETEVSAALTGVEPGDDVTVTITIKNENESIDETYDSDKTYAAGSYDLSVTLTGDDAGKYAHYTQKNNTATLEVQKKPVVITITDNVTTTDSVTEPTINASGLSVDDYEIIYKDEHGTVVTTPTAAGTYEVWVTITNPNYRYPDGSSDKQVGSFAIAETEPVLHTITFTGSNVSEMEAPVGSLLILPDCTQEKEGYQFVGWTYDGKTYRPGDRFTVHDGDVTFKAQWEETFDVTVTVEEQTGPNTTAPVKNAAVSLWKGANKLNEVATGTDGRYIFTDLIPGIYNLVVSKDERTVTSKVEIDHENVTSTATLPLGVTNSIVKVTTGSPDIVVGNLDTVFEKTDDTVYTEADQTTVRAGGKVEFTFTADEKQKEDQTISDDMGKIKAAKNDAVTVGLVMDYTITKSVTDNNKTTTTNITQSNVLLEVLLPLPADLQGKADYAVYRVHNGMAQELKQGEANKNYLGEYFTVSSDKTGLTLYVKCFSTYAIGYSETPLTSDDNDVPTDDNTSSSSGGGGESSTSANSPVIMQPDHGTITVSPENPQKGDSVTITAKPEDGYIVDTVTVTDAKGQAVAVTPNSDGTYTFVQPAGNVTVTVTFRQQDSVSNCSRDESCPMALFTDTDRSAWYHDGIHYCVEHGLMMGTSETTFVPNGAITRGMVVTILWRLAGSPILDVPMGYQDVASDAWYCEAVRWADSAGVVTGYGNGKFGPNDPITREQMAAMLWRYAQYQEMDISVGENTNILSYLDAYTISEYAVPAMQWACGEGVIQGVGGGRLVPTGTTTRAQAACIFQRFDQK